MTLTDSFIPTAGVAGLLPMVTYFFLIVATYAFLSFFVFALVTRPITLLPDRSLSGNLSFTLTAGITAVTGLSYYLIQGYYHTMLAELTTVTDASDRQTLIREAYNAIGQYRYMAWAITVPLLLLQVVSLLKIQLSTKLLVRLLPVSFFMIITGYIGHQQLSFDNEIQTGPKLIWGAVSMACYAVILLMLSRFRKTIANTIRPDEQRIYRLVGFAFGTFWIMYPLGYVLTMTPIDFNWIHILYTLADVISIAGVGIGAYSSYTQPIETDR